MMIFDSLFTVVLSLAILSAILFLLSLWLWGTNKRQQTKLKFKKPKNKQTKGYKKWRFQLKKVQKEKAKAIKRAVLLLLLSSVCFAGAFYYRHYQAMNMGGKDSEAVAQSYSLLSEIKRQMDQVPSTENPKKVEGTLYDLSARLTSYGTRRADGRLSQQGQLLLNRLYLSMKELGLNLGGQSIETLKSPEIYDGYLKDINKTEQEQKKIFVYFQIDETKLKK